MKRLFDRFSRKSPESAAAAMVRARTLVEAGDHAAALEIWGPLAHAGVARAQNNVGGCFAHGQGVEVDHALALRWLTLSAEAGDALGQRNLGSLYFEGLGVPRDYAMAARWFRAAAEQDDGEAQDMLSWMLLDGEMLEQEPIEARKWAEAAAAKGHAGAATRLGTILYNAMGTPRDAVSAVAWWHRATAAGDGDGAAMLGAAYHLGQGVPADQAEAFLHLTIATRRGSLLAARFLPIVRGASFARADPRWRGRGAARDHARCRREGREGGGMIVGTAGHVDHGKTTLVHALTGVDTDRLKEEKARGITIDLGFAYMPGPDGATIGFVDVPGHERLVRTMVAGAAGIDYALVVIAGDDGVMPQTREHLDILGLLGLTRGVVVVTKVDRIDATRRTIVAEAIAAMLAGTSLAEAEILFVSAATGQGMEALRATLSAAARDHRRRDRDGLFRLSVDRAFTLKGVGTIVTGTALAGRIHVDDEVTLLPAGVKARVRSLHAQNQEAREGQAGDRCALALAGAGVGLDVVSRGTWISAGASPMQSRRFDADLGVLAREVRSLGQWTPVHLHCGASDVPARVVVLSSDTLAPGARGFVQIVLDQPLPLRRGDLFILRDQSAQRTIGGGTVLDPRAPLRKRRSLERLARLDALREPDPTLGLSRLLALDPGFVDLGAFAADRGLAFAHVETIAATLGLIALKVGDTNHLVTPERWHELAVAVTTLLAGFHADNPELPGLAGERLRLIVLPVLPKPLFVAARDRLAAEKRIAAQGHWLRLPDHVAQLGADDKRLAALMLPLIAETRFRPPRIRDIGTALVIAEPSARRAAKALARTGVLMELAHDHFFQRETVVEMAAIARDLTDASATGFFGAADFRDRLDNGRKVAIQVLEYFDRHGLTRRDGDLRRVVKDPALIFGTSSESIR